ncbi:MAG: hypothetical protein KAI47_15530 [Deltaproteobacteria bacterium]|nr:hypothetical protein [Deltaproteobacteria bacterium]
MSRIQLRFQFVAALLVLGAGCVSAPRDAAPDHEGIASQGPQLVPY